MKLDEQALRRPEFQEGPKVRLGDGQEWTFPLPRVRVFPLIDPDSGEVSAGARRYWCKPIEDQLEALAVLDFDEPGARVKSWSLQFEIAANLLRQNYDLNAIALDQLLSFTIGDVDDSAMWEAIAEIVAGTSSPKATGDGSGSPS